MSSSKLIEVESLSRTFTIAEGKSGFWGSVANLFSTKHSIKKAVDDVSFSIAEGEFVGYVGENGAGKSTTIKMLTGILTPTSGRIRVAGVVPYEDRRSNAANIGVVFGQRTQLWWDLPVRESFDLLRSIFRVPDNIYRRNYEELIDTLGLSELLKVPVRKLSLGQRMRCDLAASLLHSPKVLFLDEPTIGLDLIAKEQVRTFLKKINRERNTTIILTTHDMEDIEQLCERILILDEGSLVYDGRTQQLKEQYVAEKVITIELADDTPDVAIEGVRLIKSEANKRWLSYPMAETSAQEVIGKILANYKVRDIAIHEPKVEGIIKKIYEEGNLQKKSGGVAR